MLSTSVFFASRSFASFCVAFTSLFRFRLFFLHNLSDELRRVNLVSNS